MGLIDPGNAPILTLFVGKLWSTWIGHPHNFRPSYGNSNSLPCQVCWYPTGLSQNIKQIIASSFLANNLKAFIITMMFNLTWGQKNMIVLYLFHFLKLWIMPNQVIYDMSQLALLATLSVFYAYQTKEWVSPPLLSPWVVHFVLLTTRFKLLCSHTRRYNTNGRPLELASRAIDWNPVLLFTITFV